MRIAIFSWFSFIVWIFYNLFYPPILFEYKDNPLPIIKKVVKRGEETSYRANYCKYISNSAHVTHVLEWTNPKTDKPELVHYQEFPKTNVPVGCNIMNVPVYIPPNVPLGKYRVIKIIVGKVNNLRSFNFQFYSECFEVIE